MAMVLIPCMAVINEWNLTSAVAGLRVLAGWGTLGQRSLPVDRQSEGRGPEGLGPLVAQLASSSCALPV